MAILGWCQEGKHKFDDNGHCIYCPKVLMSPHPETRTGR